MIVLKTHLLRFRNTFTANKKHIYCGEKTHLLRSSGIKNIHLYFVFFDRIMDPGGGIDAKRPKREIFGSQRSESYKVQRSDPEVALRSIAPGAEDHSVSYQSDHPLR